MKMTKKAFYRRYATELKPISDAKLEVVRRQTAKILWIKDKTGKCECEYCQSESKIEHTKHLGKAKCPVCGHKLTVRHAWRANWFEDIDWRVTADSIDEGIICYRYILCNRVNGEIKVLKEQARLVEDWNEKKVYHLETDYGKTDFYDRERTRNYFRESGMMNSWVENRYCCRAAEPFDKAVSVARTIVPELKYCTFKGYKKGNYFSSVVFEYSKHYELFEKLEKAGFANLIWHYMDLYDTRYFDELISPDAKGELHKMLRITKDKLRYLRTCKDHALYRLEWLQKVEEIEAYDICQKVHLSITNWNELTQNLTKGERNRNIKYCIKHSIAYDEYMRYLEVAEVLGYDIHDKSYQYPKDFRKMDEKMSDEWKLRKNEAEAKKLGKQSAKIKAISDGLKKLPELQELLQGSKGFLVYVPESAEDLLNEGTKLHNCIGTYVERVAQKKTLLFFIRRLNDASAPFVAMEYCHGQIVQCRYDHNKAVEEDCEIYSFAEKIAEIMRRNKILAA